MSVDTKKKELVGQFRTGGREWHPQGQPEEVEVYDFASNSRPLECDSLWFAHFDSEIMIRHLPRAEMMAKSGLPEPERAPIRQSGTGLGS